MAKPKEARRLVDTALNFSDTPEVVQAIAALGLTKRQRTRLVLQAQRKAEKRAQKVRNALP